MSQSLSDTRHGITKVDVIVVMIIFALGLILLPVFSGNSREKARTEICLSNMRQVGLAVQSYESKDHSAAYPDIRVTSRT